MIAIITCSTQTTVMPRFGNDPITVIISLISGGVSPAMTSSSNSNTGSAASARASSSFLSWPTVRLATDASASSMILMNSIVAIATVFAWRGVWWRRNALSMTRIPKGADLILNKVAGAPGFWIGNVIVMAGVPSIMQAMLDESGI